MFVTTVRILGLLDDKSSSSVTSQSSQYRFHGRTSVVSRPDERSGEFGPFRVELGGMGGCPFFILEALLHYVVDLGQGVPRARVAFRVGAAR